MSTAGRRVAIAAVFAAAVAGALLAWRTWGGAPDATVAERGGDGRLEPPTLGGVDPRRDPESAGRATEAASPAGTGKRVATIAGVVVDEGGSPVGRARVTLCRVGASHEVRSEEKTGAFRIEFDDSGEATVHADDPAIGAGQSDPFRMDRGRDLDVGSIILRPRGTIAGRVVLPDGTPGSSLTVSGWLIGAVHPAFPECGADGVEFAFAQADGQGRFVLRNLRRGRYRLGGVETREPADIETGTLDAVVTARARLVVLRLVDSEGKPVPDVEVGTEWGGEDSVDHDVSAQIFPDGAGVVVDVPADVTRARLSFGASGLSADPLDVAFADGTWRTSHTVVLRPPSERITGTLAVEVEDAAGTPVRPFVVEVAPSTDDSILTREDHGTDEGRLTMALAPGPYDLWVVPGAHRVFVPGTAGRDTYARTFVETRVVANETTVVRVRARKAGWLRVRAGPSDSAVRIDRTWVRRPYAGKDRRILGTWSDPKDDARFAAIFPAGEPQYFSAPLEPGPAVLVLRTLAKTELTFPFDVEAGKTTDLEVALPTR